MGTRKFTSPPMAAGHPEPGPEEEKAKGGPALVVAARLLAEFKIEIIRRGVFRPLAVAPTPASAASASCVATAGKGNRFWY
jgi:hypothetical protein